MSDYPSMTLRVLYLIICAAPPAQQTPDVVSSLQANRWDVCVIATPQASRWIDLPALATLTGHMVRTDYKLPGEADPLPKADAMLVMPATFNTINKWAQGIGDTLATSILCEALGRGTPQVIAVPCLKMDLVRHPAFSRSVDLLRENGVRVLHEPERYPSPLMVPFERVLETLHKIVDGIK
ncbi:MAG TPA: flavoprotein [Ktedonobacteraceae bacterium]|nr:flavoprotein [Ktedonobacteraceae bacterium]